MNDGNATVRKHVTTFKGSKAFLTGEKMPAGLRHQPGDVFDWQASEVIQWIASNPVFTAYLFEKLRQSGAIVYDAQAGAWKGSQTEVPNEG